MNFENSTTIYYYKTFPIKTNVSLQLGSGKINIKDVEKKQFFINLQLTYNFYLNRKNYFNINYQNNFLQSETYILIESYLFGGVKSIRGFTENSLQANFMTALITEYRYIVSSELYIHTIIDYGYYKDNTINYEANLVGFGLGIGLRTKNGNLKLSFSNGSNDGQNIKFINTIANLNYNIEF